MNLKNPFKYISAALLFVVATSCNDRMDVATGEKEDFEPGYYTLRVPLDILSADISTRASFAENGSTVKLGDVWVGIYDPVTGKQIGSASSLINSSQAPSHTNGESAAYVDVKNLFFNDVRPNVYVVGVANYEGVEATTPELNGTTQSLAELLAEAHTWSDFINIIIDARSA